MNVSTIDAEIALRTEDLPTVLWIELTSRCPFDCVFCSRQLLRGNGQHMDFDMYSRLIAELRDPAIIRLNYSGESIHYPRLVESCRAAAATGAEVELVTALAALPDTKLEALATSGLTNLTVSLHTLDPDQFRQIYGFGTLEAMKHHIECMQAFSHRAPRGLSIDFAFVAMERNIDQLVGVVGYAESLGIGRVAVHPVIRRDPIRETFELELDNGRLRPEFLAKLHKRIEEARVRHPAVSLDVSTPELEQHAALDHDPVFYPHPLPERALIHGCDQDPWQTVHILSDGRVVSCEVRDQIVLGSLVDASLHEVWHGNAYNEFRRYYLQARDEKCRNCVYKRAYVPGPVPTHVIPGNHGAAALLAGWYGEEPGAIWSGNRGVLRLMSKQGQTLTLRLVLPPAVGRVTHLNVDINGRNIARVVHDCSRQRELDITQHLVEDGPMIIRMSVDQTYRPSQHLGTADRRDLGVALLEARVGRR